MKNDQVSAIMTAAQSGAAECLIQPFDFETTRQNELVFFFKPGCFQAAEHGHVQDILALGLRELQAYNVMVAGILLLGGSRLDALEIMDRHYGYINRLSKHASRILHPEEIPQISAALGLTSASGQYQVLGGHEFLQRFPEYDAARLQALWTSKHSHKLRSGFYVQEYTVAEQHVILVNGFHPNQLAFFTEPTHKIALLLLQADAEWHTLKYAMVGDTFPEHASAASIRGELYRHHQRYGLNEVTVSNNMVHLSAGPFEAMFEIHNFLHAIPTLNFDVTRTNMARLMRAKGLTEKDIDRCLSNPTATIGGEEVDLFTLTEDKNSGDAIDLYVTHFTSLR
jgi:hypothetical protein